MIEALAMLIAVVAVIGDVGIEIAHGLLAVGLVAVVAAVGWYGFLGVLCVRYWLQDRAEARLNRREAEFRRTVLTLADAIAEERIQARESRAEMLRASYLARGEVPGR